MYRYLVFSAFAINSLAASLRDEEQFVFPGQMIPQFGMMPQFRFPDQMFSPNWGMAQPFDQFPLQADALLNSLMSSFDNMLSGSMISMPEIIVSDDCVVTVRLAPETNVNDTDIKVYTSERDIELHITTVKIREWRADPLEALEGSTESVTEAAADKTESSKAKSKLRGFGEMASSTTIRKFPAPAQCDVFSEEAKATLDTHTNSLLIKFPMKELPAISENTVSAAAAESGAGQQVMEAGGHELQEVSRASIDLAPMMNRSPEKRSWWSSMFEKEEKKTVPIVNREEF